MADRIWTEPGACSVCGHYEGSNHEAQYGGHKFEAVAHPEDEGT